MQQVDILISKNQVLQTLYHVASQNHHFYSIVIPYGGYFLGLKVVLEVKMILWAYISVNMRPLWQHLITQYLIETLLCLGSYKQCCTQIQKELYKCCNMEVLWGFTDISALSLRRYGSYAYISVTHLAVILQYINVTLSHHSNRYSPSKTTK